MLTHHTLLLVLLPLLGCVMPKRWVVVDLANGGSSPPLLLHPLDHDHLEQPLPDALALNAPTASTQAVVAASVGGHQQASGNGGHSNKDESNKDEINKDESNKDAEWEEAGMIQVTGDKTSVTPNPTSTPTSTSTSTASPTSTTTLTTTTTTNSAPTTTTTTTERQAQSSQAASTTTRPPPQPCHLSCLDALNATHLTPTDSLVLGAGSSLTLECQLPLVPELVLEDMQWLFHPQGTPEGRCSLTPNEYLSSCSGFPSLSETDYSNQTFLKQTLTLSDLGTNHTGDYMCQVRVTCCPGDQQHLMSQLHKVQVSVTVWWTDYTLELAGTGVAAGVLLLTLLGVSVYSWRNVSKNHYQPVVEVEAPAVLHLPLIDDQDTDSFCSSTNEQEAS